jgi:hypothetical protein
LELDTMRARLVHKLAKKFPVEKIPDMLAKWATKMQPVPWTGEVTRLVNARLDKQTVRICQAVKTEVENLWLAV